MRISLTEATTWEQINEAATMKATCIRDNDGANRVKARRTWETFGQEEPKYVRYFIIRQFSAPQNLQGYARAMRIDNNNDSRQSTWVLDYISPMSYHVACMVAQALGGTCLVKETTCDDSEVTASWKRLRIQTPSMAKYLYSIQKEAEATWLIVP